MGNTFLTYHSRRSVTPGGIVASPKHPTASGAGVECVAPMGPRVNLPWTRVVALLRKPSGAEPCL